MSVIYYHKGEGAYPHIEPSGALDLAISSRPLCISSLNDVVIVNPLLRKEAEIMLVHYDNHKIPVARYITSDKKMLRAVKLPEDSVEYFSQIELSKLPLWQQSLKVKKELDDKVLFHDLCMSCDVPSPRVYRNLESKYQDIREFPLLVKLNHSACGEGILLVHDAEQLQDFCKQNFAKLGNYHAQGFVPDGRTFTIVVDTYNICWRWSSLQLQDGFKHVANKSFDLNFSDPDLFLSILEPEWKLIYAQVEKLRQAIIKKGYRGYLGFDVIVNRYGHSFLECNPRWSSALFYAKVAQRKGWTSWESRRIKTKYNSFINHDLKELHPIFGLEEPPVIVNWGGVLYGEIDVVGTTQMFAEFDQ